ncbi:tail fiber assembly [Pseudomonas phage vB_PpuM-Amme-3]|uniref:Tail fiber assembly n=1 Tax=Pseudomonas phage vB_PpuM-Amme-3 TaxID=3132617 RepID=A0AAX4MX49_9CAUD
MARKKKVVKPETKIVKGYSNAVALPDGKISCTIEHAEYGALPFTYCPNDKEQTSIELGLLLEADGVVHSKLDECPSVKMWEARGARTWRNTELARADVIINKIEDFEIEGDSKPWRQYRATLRNWPDTPDFPNTKPTAPDA